MSQPEGLMNRAMAWLGTRLIHFASFFVNVTFRFPFDLPIIARHFLSKKKIFRNVFVKEIYHSGLKTLPVVVIIGISVASVFMGMFPFDSFKQGAENVYGTIFAVLILRELAPLVTAVVIAVRSTTYITIQLTQMKIGGEIKTLEILGIEPVLYLGSMRVFAGMFIAPLLGIYFSIAALCSGALTVFIMYGESPGQFMMEIFALLSAKDIFVFVIKMLLCGYIIYRIAVYNGITAKEERNMIISRTIRAITQAITAVLIIDYFLMMVFYVRG